MSASKEPRDNAEKKSKKPGFEDSLERIEEIVERLEGGDLTLDESLSLFQEGVELSRGCQSVLDEAQRRIELLIRAADGTLATQPLGSSEEE